MNLNRCLQAGERLKDQMREAIGEELWQVLERKEREMKTRKEIEDQIKLYASPTNEPIQTTRIEKLILEVLLDIRELLLGYKISKEGTFGLGDS